MVNIFLAYSSKDKNIIDTVIDNLRLSPEYYNLWYYQQVGNADITMEKIIDQIARMDLFIVFLTENSLNSPNVQRELIAAIHEKQMKEICAIIVEDSIHPKLDNRIPDLIRNNIYYAKAPINAVLIIKNFLKQFRFEMRGI